MNAKHFSEEILLDDIRTKYFYISQSISSILDWLYGSWHDGEMGDIFFWKKWLHELGQRRTKQQRREPALRVQQPAGSAGTLGRHRLPIQIAGPVWGFWYVRPEHVTYSVEIDHWKSNFFWLLHSEIILKPELPVYSLRYTT